MNIASKANKEMANQAMRVLALCARRLDDDEDIHDDGRSINDTYNELGYADGDSLKNGEVKGVRELNDAYPLEYDVSTISGRTFMANHLEILQRKLASSNGENNLSCNENNGLGGGYCDQ